MPARHRSAGRSVASGVVAAVIDAEGVVKRFGATTALDGATFNVGHGVTGLLGANGAGKTTLIGLVLGLSRPDEGAIEVLGLDPVHAGPGVRALVGYSPEHHILPADMRARRPRGPPGRGARPPPARRRRPGQRRALAGGPGRGALPRPRHHVDRAAAAGEARRGPRPRPAPAPARRAHRRARPGAARRHARPSSAGSAPSSGSTSCCRRTCSTRSSGSATAR